MGNPTMELTSQPDPESGKLPAASMPVTAPDNDKGMDRTLLTGAAKPASSSTIPQSVFNLVKNIVGAGVLGLPSGIAALSDGKTALIPAYGLLLVMAALSGYCFSLLGLACYATKTSTFGQAWAVAVSPRTAWLPKVICSSKAFIGCLAYSMIIADSFSAIFESAGMPKAVCGRTQTLWFMTVFFITPLCLLRSLKALSPFSLLGVSGMMYTTVFMAIRWLDGSYTPGGKFYDEIDAEFRPAFNSGDGNPASAFVLVSMASSAYIAHYNAPKYYMDLKDRSTTRFNILTGIAFGTALAFFLLASSFGFLTFGGNSNGLILNNYALSDSLATAARVCIGVSIVLTYPLACVGFRDGVIEMAVGPADQQSRRTLDIWTIGLVLATTVLANVVTDLGFLLSFSGAFLGAWVAYILPARIALGTQQRGYMPSTTGGRMVNYTIIIVGLVLCVLGSVVSVLHTFTDLLDAPSGVIDEEF